MFKFGMNMPFYLMMLYGSIMIVMVLILRGLFRNRLPKFVFPVLWCIVLLRFVIPFSVSSPLSIPIPWNFLSPPGIAYSSGMATSTMENVSSLPNMATTVSDTSTLRSTASSDVVEVDSNAAVAETVYQDTYFNNYSYVGGEIYTTFYNYFYVPALRILLIIYILGVITVAGILGLQKYRYLKRLRGGLLIEHNETINTMLRDLGMGHVLVFSSDEIASPMVCGLLNPRIYLPTKMEFQNTMLLRHVLSHETMHIRRKDNWLKCIMLIVLCLNWFNPLVWIMAKCLASDLEAACDAAVLKQGDEDTRKEYAFSLLAMAVSASRTSLLYSAFSKTEVEKRVKNILSYKKMTFLALLFTILLMAGSMTAFASIGQAPFWSNLTAFCSSDNSRWGVRASITRDIALGENAQERAEDVVFSVLGTDETGDPEVIEDRILAGLAKEFGVERGAFHVETSFIISDELLREDYEPWGLSTSSDDKIWTYKGRSIRTFEDKMVGYYQSGVEGKIDVSVQRDHCGKITSVTVWQAGDPEYDTRTRKYYEEGVTYKSYRQVAYPPEVSIMWER